MKLEKAKVVITGGSSGIGLATAQLFIKKGAQVLITGRDEVKLNKVANKIGAIPLHFDISNLSTIPQKAQEALSLLEGDLDVLVNNAGVGVFPELGQITAADLQQVYTTNVFGLTLLTQALLPVFKQKESGTIINIGSTASQKGFARGTVYAASKFAVRGITQCWQAELRKFNIRVSLVNPSEVTTAFASANREEREEMPNKLGAQDIADAIVATVALRDKAFVPEVTVWATNPF